MEMTMGMRIRECRVKMGMTQEELAEALFTKKCTISAYETGKIDVKVSEYSVAARFFRNHPFFASNEIISVIKYWYQIKAVYDNEE